MLSLLVIILVVGLGIAFYLGWLKFYSGGNKSTFDLTMSVDLDKFETDTGTDKKDGTSGSGEIS